MSKLHVVFDLDDTLYPERAHAASGFKAAGELARREWGIVGLADEMTRLLDAGNLGAVFKLGLETFMPDHTQHHLDALRQAYRDHEPDITLYDDGQWALDHYGRQGPLGLITDGNAKVQQSKVDALAIAHHFEAIVLTGALGAPREFHKPHPRAYEIIASRIGDEDDQYVYIGDNPSKDFVTPNALGWLSIQVIRERTIHDQAASVPDGDPKHRITTLRELPDILGF